MDRSVAGIDVGGDILHVVVLTADDVTGTAVVKAGAWDALATALTGITTVAVDAPAAASTAPHVGDGIAPNPKFRTARCAEIHLGRTRGIWVPWVTPQGSPFPGWMATGFAVFDELSQRGIRAVETYPQAVFRTLAGGSVPSKRTPVGLSRRVESLRAAGIGAEHLEMWSHDAIDALAAALVARNVANAEGTEVSCGHDGSAIWLP